MPTFEKGSSIKASYDGVRHVLGEADWDRVVQALPDDVRQIVLAPEKHAMIPSSVTGQLYSTVFNVVCGGDRASIERLLRTAGTRDAEEMLNGVFSVFARFVSPHQAFKRAGGMLASVYTGVGHETIEDEDGKGGVLVLTGLGEEPFSACLICGWIEQACRRFGATNPRVHERQWDAGHNASDRLEFVIRWE